MRRACQRAVQTTCAHRGQPFHAGHAVLAALQQTRPYRLSTACRKDDKDDKPTVRWFVQEGKTRDTIRPDDDDNEEQLQAIEKEAKSLEEIKNEFDKLGMTGKYPEIDELEDELEKQKGREEVEEWDEDENFDEDEEFEDDGHSMLDWKRRAYMEKFRDENDVFDLHSLEVQYQMPKLMKRHISRFNASLRLSTEKPQDLKVRRDLWAMFLRCSHLPGFLEQIPPQAWKALWRSQSAEPFFNEQAGHLLQLADHMEEIGVELTPTQKLTHIKALEADGQMEEALNKWHSARSQLEADGNVRHEFAALGVTLECSSGRPQQAQDIAFAVIANQKKNLGAIRLLIPVITAWAKLGSEEDLKRAWLLYLLVRRSLGKAESEKDAIDAQDFDQIYLGFVDAGRRDLAVLVFKDLVLAKSQSEHDSLQVYSSYNQMLDDLHKGSKTPEQINETSLDILSHLPKRFENKFFYASWMKRLIGMERVDVAVQVMELMYERGVSPDAKHVNGVIGAWLRQGTSDEQRTALELAWTMADERLKLVARRKEPGAQETTPRSDLINGLYVPPHLRRRVPAATTETLCLLLLYYGQKKLSADVERVERLLFEAELSPNSYFMNHLMYYYYDQGKWIETWDFYRKMSRQVRPDLTTYACLWDCAHGLTKRYEQMDKFPAPRRLFSTMMNWFAQLNPRDRAAAQEDFSMHIYTRITQVFMQFKDTKGMLIALYAMRDSFGQYPNDETIRAVTIQVAQMSETRQAGHPQGRSRVRRKKAAGHELHRNIERAGKVLQMILENRNAELERQRVDPKTLSDEQRGEESLFVLAEFLRAADRRSVGSVQEEGENIALSEEIDQVAWEMAAGPFQMGPPMYNTVK